jgi:amino acid adenylation domain-containing protein
VTPPSATLLRRLGDRGVQLWSENGQLRYRAPAGALDPDLRAAIVDAKPALLALLADSAAALGAQLPPIRPARPVAGTDTEGYALSNAQERFWFMDQTTPGNPAFNLPEVLRLTGELNERALSAALGTLVDRHDALRTTFVDHEGVPVQVIAPAGGVAFDVPVVDLVSSEDRNAAARKMIDAEFAVGFDLARGPLVRARLLRLDVREHLLLLTFHHIVFDGWSYPVFLEELAELYRAALDGRAPDLPPVAVAYRDYAAWQRDRLQGSALADGLQVWRELLHDAPSALELPTDHPRPARQTFAGAAVPFSLPEDLTAALTRLGREQGATLFMVLLAAYATVLGRTSGQRCIVVGTPVAGRPAAELERLVGLLVNMLPLRVDLDGRPTFRQLVGRVREVALRAFGAQDVPFERLVEEFAGHRDPSRTPLFGAVLALQNLPTVPTDLAGVRVEPVFGATGVAKYDVSVVLAPADGALHGALEYNTDLFDAGTAERLVDHLRAFLHGAAAAPDVAVDELPLMTDGERRRVAALARGRAAEPCDGTLTGRLIDAAARFPDATAVEGPDGTLTYAELTRRADALAADLRGAGVGSGAVVGVLCERGATAVTAMCGVLRAGAAYLPLDPTHPGDRIALSLADAGVAVIVTTTRARVPRGFAGRVLELDLGTAVEDPGDGQRLPLPTPDDLAYVISTSGSTGRPKGVRIPHRAVANFVDAMRETPGMGPDDVVLSVISFTFDASVLELFVPLSTGAKLVIATDVNDGKRLADQLRSSGATWMSATPTTWRLLVEDGWTGSPGLTACAGGEPLRPELARDLLARVGTLWNQYGPTEATVTATIDRVTDADRVTIGRPIPNVQVHVVDERLRPQPIGVPGEICIGGAGLADGYTRPELTAERFVPDELGPEPGRRLYRTGDIGRRLPDGRLECSGRLDGQIKLRGHRIEAGEVAAVLEQLPAVSRAVVVVRPDRAGDPRLVAYLTVAPGEASPSAAALRGHAVERLPAYMVPAAYVVLDRVPVAATGKLDSAALPEPDEDAGPAGIATGPRTSTEQRVAAAWIDVLGLTAIDIDDDFFALGGESLKAVRAVRRIDPGLPVVDLLAHPTVRALAAHIDAQTLAMDGERRLIATLRRARGRARTTMVCVPFGGGTAVSFAPLARCAPDDWDVCAVELPGHDYARRDEHLLTVRETARRSAAELAAIAPEEVLVYGHCVGSALAVALAAELEAAGVRVRGVVVGANFPAAALPGALGRIARLWPSRRQNDRSLQDNLRVLGALDASLPDDERRVLARNVRHDAAESEAFFAAPGVSLKAPLLAISGGADKLTDFATERVRDWEPLSRDVRLAVLPGAEHFFVRERPAELMTLITDWLDGVPVDLRAPAGTLAGAPVAKASLRSFVLVLIGQIVSLIGTGLSTFALGVWAYQRTGSVSAFAGIAAVSLLPAIAIAPVAGAIADRVDRRAVMIACDAAGLATAAILFALASTGALRLWQLYVIAALSAIAGAFRQPAYLAGATQLVPKRYLGSASGLLQLGGAGGAIAAQMLGGAVLVLIGLRGAAVLDAASFAVAIATLLAVRFPATLFARRTEPLGTEIAHGARFLWRRPPLLALTIFFTVVNAFSGLAAVLVTPLLLAVASPAALGLVLSAQGIGMLAGSTLMATWGGARRRSVGMLAAVTLFGVSAVLVGADPRPAVAAVGLAGVGICGALVTAHWLALVQVKVPVPIQGRVISSSMLLAQAMVPLAYVLAGPLVSLAGGGPDAMGTLLIIAGVLALAWTAAGYLFAPLRRADDLLPDALLDGHEPAPAPAGQLVGARA